MSSIPNGLRNVLANLEYLSMIEDGKKPCMNDMTFVDADSWLGASMRFLHGESREIMIVHINNIIDQGIHSINEYPEFRNIILDSLERAQTGIQKLMITYSRKPHTVSQLSVCCKNIQIQIDKYSPSVGEISDDEDIIDIIDAKDVRDEKMKKVDSKIEYSSGTSPDSESSFKLNKKGKKSASIAIPRK